MGELRYTLRIVLSLWCFKLQMRPLQASSEKLVDLRQVLNTPLSRPFAVMLCEIKAIKKQSWSQVTRRPIQTFTPPVPGPRYPRSSRVPLQTLLRLKCYFRKCNIHGVSTPPGSLRFHVSARKTLKMQGKRSSRGTGHHFTSEGAIRV